MGDKGFHESERRRKPTTNADKELNFNLDSKYKIVECIGKGAYGTVFKSKLRGDCDTPDTSFDSYVVIKKFRNTVKNGPAEAQAESHLLKLLQHEHVVKFIEIGRTTVATEENDFKPCFGVVLEYCEHDLAGLLANLQVKFSFGQKKEVVRQILQGLSYIHSKNVMHRDLKPSNILLTLKGVIKIADFGLSRSYFDELSDGQSFSNPIAALAYRPPEVLLGATKYGPSIDLWAAGCIMAQMWTREPFIKGTTVELQLTEISKICGSINPERWPGVDQLKLYSKMSLPKNKERKIRESIVKAKDPEDYIDNNSCNLIDKLLKLKPNRRIKAKKALNHLFFWRGPMPALKSDLAAMLAQQDQGLFPLSMRPKRPIEPSINEPESKLPVNDALPIQTREHVSMKKIKYDVPKTP